MVIKIEVFVQGQANCEWNRMEKPGTYPCICRSLKYNRGGRRNHWGKRDHSRNEATKLVIHMKNQIGSLSTPNRLKS